MARGRLGLSRRKAPAGQANVVHHPSGTTKGWSLHTPGPSDVKQRVLVISGTIFIGVLLTHLLYPTYYTGRLIYVSHPLYIKDLFGYETYRRGIHDLYFVFYYFFVIASLRELIARVLIRPIGRWHGLSSQAKLDKLVQEAMSVIYFTVSWSVGFICMLRSTIRFGTKWFWAGHPDLHLSLLFKAYLLCQLAHWFNEIIALYLVPRRKDHIAMITHHLVTIVLVAGSYCTNYTNVALAVFLSMDLADVFLSLAKCLRYLKYQTLCNVTFGVFVVVWIIFRQYFYTRILWSGLTDLPTEVPFVGFIWEEERFQSIIVVMAWGSMLLTLKVVMLYWFWLIIKVVKKVLTGSGASDTREDDGPSSSEDETDSRRAPRKEKGL